MSIARHHAEWLSLVEVSGPFLSMPVLLRVFPQGLDAHDPEHFRLLGLAYEEWKASQESRRPDPAVHQAWIRFVLTQTLEFPEQVILEGQAIPQTLKTDVAEYGETLRPDVVIQNPPAGPDAGKPRLLIKVLASGQSLEKPLPDRHWKASPATRMMELLHGVDLRLGLVTNGEHFMLVDAPRGETTAFASWYAPLWLEEQITLRAFRSLLSVRRFFSVPQNETLEAMLSESASNQQEVTDQLGYQVRRAVEVLIQFLDQADQDHGRALLADISEEVLYEAALTVMMRLVFLFSAEERGLLLLGDPLYDQHYAVSTLRAQLREAADQHGEEVLERRFDAWCRLIAAFRAVHAGIKHDRLSLPAYGGRLFDPDRFPFLEGRKPGTFWRNTPANPLPINNRTILHLLEALQILQVKVPGGGPAEARRLSFRALDIEQIGHVYEGLLDHTAKRASEPVLSLCGSRDKEPEIPVGKLEQLRKKGEEEFAEYLHEETGRSVNALQKALDIAIDGHEIDHFRAACANDDRLWERIKPFAGLVHYDTFEKPVVILPGSVYVTAGKDRRTTGTHYTPRSLTEPIVQYTLQPLVYIGPAEGKPKEEWRLRPAKELLDLKVCDMACGSGAFLVQACRYLSERLVEAWEETEDEHPGTPGITPEGTPATGALGEILIPKDTDERLAYARRIVAARCLYGVDKNPLAVEMAKLSLWLLTVAKDRPFTFLDHAIRCGDSLVGIKDLDQLKYFSLDADKEQRQLFAAPVLGLVNQAVALRNKIKALPVMTIEDVHAKEKLLAEAEEKTARLRYAADLLISVEFQPAPEGKEALHHSMAIQASHFLESGTLEEFKSAATKALGGQPTFHWPLEFPEVMLDCGGFDALVCNPPFMGGQKITGTLGTEYRDYLVHSVAAGKRGSADLCAYFFLRAKELLREKGQFGFLATNTIAQGDTREVGLDQLTATGCTIPRAVPSRPWPGTANLEVAHVWIRRDKWVGPFLLDEKPVPGITPFLTQPGTVTGKPYRLAANAGKSFQGSNVLGMGFVLEPEEAERLIKKNPKNKDVLFPYLNGDDLNSRPDQSPSRWVINFFDWPLEKAEKYPDCMKIVRDKVYPDRMAIKGTDPTAEQRRRIWWRFTRPAMDLYSAIAGLKRVLVTAQTSKHLCFTFIPPNVVYSHTVIVIANSNCWAFSIGQSSPHEIWVRSYASTLETRLRYLPTDCFENFPFPHSLGTEQIAILNRLGEMYHEHRSRLMLANSEGLTKTYNRFNDPSEADADVQQLRELHVEMDKAVAAAYGWDDLDLGHGFHETKQGARFTISDAARREVLERLLKLNHQRYEEEVCQGLHEKKGKSEGKRRGRKSSISMTGPTLFDKQDEEPEQKKGEPELKSAPIDEFETDDVMGAFRQAARGRGLMDRDTLLKEVALVLGFQRLGPRIEETLRNHLRAAIRRRIIEAEGPLFVRAATAAMADYTLEDLREAFRSVMQKGAQYEREDVIHALARYLGFSRVTETIGGAIKSAINSAIRHGILGYERAVIWREE